MWPSRTHDRREYHACSRYSEAAAIAAARGVDAMYHAIEETEERSRSSSRPKTRLKRRPRRDYLTEALQATDRRDLVPRLQASKRDLSHEDVRSRHGRQAFHVNRKRPASDWTPALAHVEELRLERITASLTQRTQARSDSGTDASTTSFTLADPEISFLQLKGFTLGDVQAWVTVISTQDPHVAAIALADHNAKAGSQPVPSFVLQYLLRRPYLSARALRTLIQQAWELCDTRLTSSKGPKMSENAVFILFNRLLRCARVVWPRAMDSVTDLLLQYLPKAYPGSGRQIEHLTHMLNKAMHLLAIPTALEPFKDISNQERAVVRVLRFMAEHHPPLQLNREGYRAVIQVQLAQKKTPSEQQWAELKALSWPPWKQERTAMDSSITAEHHGLTRAGDTLRRMREAGYAPLGLEKVAELFAGWDTDRTPTVQTRALLGTQVARVLSEGAIWAARITTTRTAQEAWAAYLAFEDAKLPAHRDAHQHQDVYLAILQKLHAEEKRKRVQMVSSVDQYQSANRRDRILPGDVREVEPLPPSTHLYTYTRTPVPTVEDFVGQLQRRSIHLKGHSLAFVVAKAATLQLGFSYLRSGQTNHPAIHDLLLLDPTADLASVPRPVFTAFIELLCRHSNVPLTKITGRRHLVSPRFSNAPPVLDKQVLNLQHPLVFALELLKLRPTTFRPAWNLVLRALSQDASLTSMRFLFRDRHLVDGSSSPDGDRGALLAYRLLRRVLSMMQELHLDLDTRGFHYLCLAVENMAFSCWKVIRHDVNEVAPGQTENSAILRTAVSDANALMRSTSHAARLRGLFNVLVGDEGDAAVPASSSLPRLAEHHTPTRSALPRLLAVPSPALLHAYIRSLGWLGDHAGLLTLLHWLVEYRHELSEQRAKDRNGEAMMRKAIIALRVFLERSWLDVQHRADRDGETEEVQTKHAHDLRLKNLRRLEAAASAEAVREAERLVDSVEEWRGWPSDDEVAEYCLDGRFQQIQSIYNVD